MVPDRFFDEIHRSRLHRLNSHWYGATARDHDGWKLVPFGFEALDHLDTAHARHQRIDQKASSAGWTIGFEEGRAIGEKFHGMPIFLEQIAHRLADGTVIVDDEYGGRLSPVQRKR